MGVCVSVPSVLSHTCRVIASEWPLRIDMALEARFVEQASQQDATAAAHGTVWEPPAHAEPQPKRSPGHLKAVKWFLHVKALTAAFHINS